MPESPIESLSAKLASSRQTDLNSVSTPTRRLNRRAGYTSDAIVRQEFGLTDSEALEDLTINQYGPGTNQAINSVLVPVAGGPNSDAAVVLASSIASEWAASITLLTVVPEDTTDDQRRDAGERLDAYTDIVTGSPVETTLVRSNDVVSKIAAESEAHELLVIGASERSLFKQFFSGSVPNKLRRQTHAPMFVVSQ
jgi:nucleotide-binding universal stress UspA family protein